MSPRMKVHDLERESRWRIIVVAADRLVQAGLASLLTESAGFRVVARVREGGRALALLTAAPADVVLWDLGWGSESHLEQTAEELEAITATGTPCIVLVDDPSDALAARSAGASGLLSREVDPALLCAAIPAVATGLLVIDPAVSGALWPGRDRRVEPLAESLTAREMEVLQLLADGLSNRAIGIRLEISEHTAKFHVTAIMTKLGAQSRTEAVVRATRLGLIYL
jgi:two-component system nitrate/nitrite response regulator NarL